MTRIPSDRIPAAPILSARGLTKAYAGVKALEHVDLELRAGEIHALCGENGAGKSTLIKILGGVLPWGSYGGSLILDGAECRFRGPREAIAGGCVVIHQELALAPDLSVLENVFLGREHVRHGWLDLQAMQSETARLLASLGQTDIHPDQPVRELPVGKRQMVEIARALGQGRILILDEPTSALSSRESGILLDLLLKLKGQGLTMVYVSHKLEEVFSIADRITVLRNGRSVATLDKPRDGQGPGFQAGALISLMVGRKLEEVFPPRTSAPAEMDTPLMSVRDWTVPSPVNPQVTLLSGISFDLRKGEILGVAGLMGSGRTELVESLFGLGPASGSGEIRIEGEAFTPQGPGRSVARGLALVPEDRRNHGLILEQSIRHNVTGACLQRFCRFGQLIDQDAERGQAEKSMREWGVKAPHGDFIAGMLSGGNQQKVVLAKWLLTGPRILFLDDPTRGVDVGAKAEIYRLIQGLAESGIGIVLISSENEEVLRLSHRILVLRQGRLVGEFAADAADPEAILELCAGGALI